ncbi:SNF2 super family, partial [Micromonas pusilla CCMP1545]
MAKHLAAKAHAAAAKSPASKAKSPKGGGGGGKKTASASALLYCVKWEGCGYRRRSWETAGDLDALKSGKPKLVSFKRRHAQNPDLTTEPFPAQYLVVDRSSEEEDDDDDDADDAEPSHEYLVKWRGLGYGEATWETAALLSSDVDAAHVAAYEKRNDLKAKRAIHATAAENQKNGAKLPAKPTPPEFKNNMALREYQVTSFEWMVGNYRRRQNVILGDEMGLGKTAQCIAVMEHVRTKHLAAPRPFLVVAPLTTLGHWKREMEKWTDMNVVTLDGTARDREVCQETEFYFESRGAKGPAKFDVLLISFETARRLTELIAEFQWALCVVDEAHKLKDVNSMTTQAVMDIGYDWLLLLTGTPIQNNVKELFGMMHVLDPVQYPSWEEFQNEHCGGQDREVDADQVMQLRKVLQPRMLRRMKEDVETIPAKEEIVVWVELTAEQRAYYRMIYEKQVHVLMEGNKSKNVPQLRNLCMELRKVCNHPFLCDGAAAKAAADAAAAGVAPPTPPAPPTSLDLLTGASGKMVLVAKLLAKLKSEGKKVLIFSQFTIVLDILEDYLGMMKYEYERLDGSTSQADRQAGIDRFNQDGQGFVYLLSTRAGGMGITLTAADTAIIYDSDWNPQNDLQ